MKLIQNLVLAGMFLAVPAAAQAQIAGSSLTGVTVTENRDVAKGWSAKHTILSHEVYNDKDEKVGTIEDIIVSPDKSVSYAILSVGGFLGLGRRDVAVPVSQFKLMGHKLVLAGATKDALRASPAFEYAKTE